MEKLQGGFGGDGKEEEGYDAVVVGSGYGGSVVACRLCMAAAGIRVCLLEKGRRWESKDFPTDSFKLLSSLRMESRNLGLSFGSKDALIQVYEQNDSVAVVGCGLGGGSLVNAGVMMPTPVRARRHPKWPNDWEKNWDHCEASAAAMLKIQSIPVKFSVGQALEDIAIKEEVGETSETSVKLTVNFDFEDQRPGSTETSKLQEMGSCLACGNCVSGCPYNAKASNDKTYLHSAIQAGCIVKTQCQVQYVIRNTYDNEGKSGSRKRRWRVYLNEIDYVTSDFVILSGGVFGTTEILFQSQMRGLRVSEALGSGFSCNGNNVAYLTGSSTPLNGYGLDKKELFKIPFQARPGPSISTSYTSSMGFTIQNAILPTAYPHLLFKGILTYGWPGGYWFFHGILDKIKLAMGLKATQAVALLALGHDESDGKIMLEKGTNKISFIPPRDPLLPRKIKVFQKLTQKLGGVLFMSKYRSTAVHLLGGCNASSSGPSHGVCNPKGQIFDPQATVHPGLYVCDASLIPCSIGINPSFTIATAAEHISRHLVQDVLEYKIRREGTNYLGGVQDPDSFIEKTKTIDNGRRSVVTFKETMRGHVGGMPCTAYLKMKMNPHGEDQKDSDIEWNLGTNIHGKSHPLLRGKVGGHVEFRGFEKDNLHIIDGDVNLCEVDSRAPYTHYMRYHIHLVASTGSRYILEGRKIMNPFLLASYAWREATTLHVTFEKVADKSSKNDDHDKVILKGELSISMMELLKSLVSFEGNKKGKFLSLLSGTLFRTYFLQMPRGSQEHFNLSDCEHKYSYPSSTLHDIKTEDGVVISCRQWKCQQNLSKLRGSDEQRNPVLLVNGYAVESYWLPTEPNDLVRTLIEEGHETWLLQSRLHVLNPSNTFTLEDVGRFDIPAAINKMLELLGPNVKVHVVAHCVGGLAIHIALMGGHVSASHIASLSCTNSSMFFKLNALSTVKMRLPLLPISMLILGNNKTLPLVETSTSPPVSLRHRLLKLIALLIPRYERCSCSECKVVSGIFGNAFWHENISPTVHQWLNKESSTRLPMAAFPHLRKICNSGFIVDSNGSNSYLIHPQRMALPTLYISGGRPLLVTPQTSFLAHKYMKLHQPGFRHERVVVEGFGHSDLLIGEESCEKVFPHILSHIRLADGDEQQGRNVHINVAEGKKVFSDSEADQYQYEEGFGITWFSPFVVLLLAFLLVSLLARLF
ncbi:uncharacterized protein LOC117638642, partial [Prunus dulcis]